MHMQGVCTSHAALMVAKVQPPDDTCPLMKAARYFAYTLEAVL